VYYLHKKCNINNWLSYIISEQNGKFKFTNPYFSGLALAQILTKEQRCSKSYLQVKIKVPALSEKNDELPRRDSESLL